MTSYTPDRKFLGTVVSVAATLAVAGILVAAVTDNAVVGTLAGIVVGASCVAGAFALVLLVRSYARGPQSAPVAGTAATAESGATDDRAVTGSTAAAAEREATTGAAETTRTAGAVSDQDTLDALEPLQAARRADPR